MYGFIADNFGQSYTKGFIHKHPFVGKKPQLPVLHGIIYKYQQGASELHRRHPQGDATTGGLSQQSKTNDAVSS
ncbi:MAG: hypothetical protein L3J83_12720 [Proteobacteria bacterium]|nr:hypothetical protein [Pseudomonadota bacterium]